MEYVLRTENLSKKYKNKLVVDNVCMNIEKGDVYGFVGENGSGKTTIIRLICALARPNEGKIELFGVDSNTAEAVKQRKKIGAVVETPSIYLNMSAVENLRMQAQILGVKDDEKIRDVLSVVGLAYLEKDKKPAGNFSLGMRQRLGVAMALLGDPEFLLLDEPMNGLDPNGIVEIRELILKLNKEKGITFLISSHILSELSLVANKYGIISKGKLLKEVTAEELSKECEQSVYIEAEDKDCLLKALDGYEIKCEGEGVRVYGEVDLNQLLLLAMKDNKLKTVNNLRAGIEDYYLSLMGGNNNA